jgi:hypothetical protein
VSSIVVLVVIQFELALGLKCPRYPIPVPIPKNDTSIQDVLKKLDHYFLEIIQKNSMPAFMINVVYDQDIIFSKGYGKANPFNPKSPPPTGDSL